MYVFYYGVYQNTKFKIIFKIYVNIRVFNTHNLVYVKNIGCKLFFFKHNMFNQ